MDENKFRKMLVAEYLRFGSVDEVFRKSQIPLPISYAHYQRILGEWGIVKSAGPNNNFGQTLDFFTRLAERNLPLEALYKRMPPSFQTSLVTIYRILSFIKEGVTRRMATGLLITPYFDERKILVGDDVSVPRQELGKPYGCVSIPVCFSRKRDVRKTAILRVLQQEVFTQKAIEKNMPDIIPESPRPFMFLDIADVRVEVFHLSLPEDLSSLKNFTSFKLQNFRYVSVESILLKRIKNLRAGVIEVVATYDRYLGLKERGLSLNPLKCKSELNYFLAGSEG